MDWRVFSIIPVSFLLWMWLELVRNEAIPVPLPRCTIRRMLELAKINEKDTVYDLGSGDGRAVLIGAKEFGAYSVGIEKNRILALFSKWNLRRKKIKNAKIIHNDIFKEKISDATIVMMYLSHKVTQKLVKKFEQELKKGTRIVSASHPIEGWKGIKKIKTGHFYSYLYKI